MTHLFYKRFAFLFLVLIALPLASRGQAQEEPDYERELSYGALFHSNGGLPGGVMVKFAKSLKGRQYHHFRLEAVNIKHPKEVKIKTGNYSYIWGKQSYLYVLRPMYGREFILFKKAPKQGTHVNLITAAGPSLGFLAPYLITYEGAGQVLRTSQYDPAIHTNPEFVRGTGSFTESFSQAGIRPGLAIKAALSFEFGAFKNSVSGFEGGFVMDAYPKKVTLYPSVKGSNIFTGVFVSVYYGNKR